MAHGRVQGKVNGEPGESLEAEEGPMAAPGIVGGVVDHVGIDGVQMDVSNQGQEVTIDVNELGAVATLEDVARRRQALVPIVGISHGDALHELAERPVVDLHQIVQVIDHPAVGMVSRAELLQPVRESIVQYRAIPQCGEHGFAMVATKDDVVVSARNMQAGRARHPCLPLKVNKVGSTLQHVGTSGHRQERCEFAIT